MRRTTVVRVGLSLLGATASVLVVTSCTASAKPTATPDCAGPTPADPATVSITLADDHEVTAALHSGQVLVVHNPPSLGDFGRPDVNAQDVLCRLPGGTVATTRFLARHPGTAAVQSDLDTHGCGGCARRIRPARITVLPPATP